MQMGSGRVIIRTEHRKFVLSSINTVNKESAYNRTPVPPTTRLCPALETETFDPLPESAVPMEISGNACARLFNFMKPKYRSTSSKI